MVSVSGLARACMLLLAVVASGCLTSNNNVGLAIESFSSLPTVGPGQAASFQVSLTNAGGQDAQVEDIKIYGLESWEALPGTCRPGMIIRPGLRQTCKLEFRAPELAGSLQNSYAPKLSVTYRYKATAIKWLIAGEPADLAGLEPSRLEARSAATAGPLQITISLRSPVLLSSAAATVPVRVDVANSGDGIVCDGGCSAATWNRVSITVSGDGVNIAECASKALDLYKGKSNSAICMASITAAQPGATQRRIEANADYGYITEKVAAIAVSNKV
ncbi:MAG: hypothetical protein HY519_03040 [Candidatus Aenigmarchaeota archaeon]|nr:hypothetical protein [Candidatus Aenigmarchaeota archaeon]